MFVAVDGHLEALIGLADTLKPDSRPSIEAIKHMGVQVVMVTGDNHPTARAIAGQAGIEHFIAQVTPAQKAEEVAKLQSEGKLVAMVGDGINDAPALAGSDVGIAIGTGTDIAIETGDITLMRGDLTGLVNTFRLSRQTMRTIKQNLFWAFIYNSLLIPVAAGLLYLFYGNGSVPSGLQFMLGEYGFLNPVLAAAAMAMSSLSVVSNSLRLRRFRPETF